MRGDFVLYEAKPGSLADWLVAHFTNGPYVHVEIDMGNGLFVGEHGNGITIHKMDAGRGARFVTPVSTEPGGIDAGMQWVQMVIQESEKSPKSHRYGWLDIVVDVAKIMGAKITFQKSGAWDCSHFVALYLQVAYAAGPLGDMIADPASISPNDLARAYGVL